MPRINIEIKGVAAELVLGNYMPTDSTIQHNWEEFYHYNDLIHSTQLITEHVSNIRIQKDEEIIFDGRIPEKVIKLQKSFCPVMVHRALYLRTECAEEAVFEANFECDNFEISKLIVETQEYDLIFKVGKSFIQKLNYDGKAIELDWKIGKPIGNICLLCRFENGYLVPIYDAVRKIEAKTS